MKKILYVIVALALTACATPQPEQEAVQPQPLEEVTKASETPAEEISPPLVQATQVEAATEPESPDLAPVSTAPTTHQRLTFEQCRNLEQHTRRQLDLLTDCEVLRLGLNHPQWDLQRLTIRLANGDRLARLARPGNDLETLAMERVKRIVHRHGGRHGI